MTQKDFDSYDHTELLQEMNDFEQKAVGVLNRMRWKPFNKRTKLELNSYKTNISKDIEEGNDLITRMEEKIGKDSLSNCLQCGIQNAIGELEKLLPRIEHALNLDYGHLLHCPRAIREWFSMTSGTEQPLVLKKSKDYVHSKWEYFENNLKHIGYLCALEFVNITYREIDNVLPETDPASIDARNFWGVSEGCQHEFVKIPSKEEFGSDEGTVETRKKMGFIDWVQDMRDLLKHMSVFSRLDELTGKKRKTGSEVLEYMKLQQDLLVTRETLSIAKNAKVVKLLGKEPEMDRIFNFKQLSFVNTASEEANTGGIFSTERLWIWMHHVVGIATQSLYFTESSTATSVAV